MDGTLVQTSRATNVSVAKLAGSVGLKNRVRVGAHVRQVARRVACAVACIPKLSFSDRRMWS